MFKHTLKLVTSNNLSIISVGLRHEAYCTASTEPVRKLKWDLISAVCLERHPVITKPMTDFEKRVQDCFNEMEVERSHKSNYELRIESEKSSKSAVARDAEDTEVVKQTIQDFEDACNEEFEAFKFASRTTEADEKNITNSLKRKLDQTLLLLIEEKLGNTNVWRPPQGIRNDGETMRQAAERVLLNTCGPDLKVSFYGNSPIGYYKYLYPRAVRKDSDGAKVFFFLAKYMKGNIPETLKHQWLDRTEVSSNVGSELRKSLFQFLVRE